MLAQDTARQIVTGADNAVGGLYGHDGTDDIVLMTAARGSIEEPKSAVDFLFRELDLTWTSDATSIPPGPQGGMVKCREAGDSNHQMAVCVWADPDAIGVLVWYTKHVKAVSPDFATIRAEIETAT